MKLFTPILAAAVLLTACDAQLSDDQMIQRSVNHKIISTCNQNGYLTPQEQYAARQVYSTTISNSNWQRSVELFASIPNIEVDASKSVCLNIRRSAQQQMVKSSQQELLASARRDRLYSPPTQRYQRCTTYSGVTNCYKY
tara:strand:+ start:553 stop:972 length:420 start_codon:yes stop_codon:yes gene_type:complete